MSLRPVRFLFTLLCAAAVAHVALPVSMHAQSFTVGGDLVYARPFGEFGHNVKEGYGLSGYGLLAGNPNSPLKLRIDVNYLNYGNKTRRNWFDSFFGTYAIDQTTSNNILAFGVGPQLMVTAGPFRPYINVHGGFSHYYTQTSLDGINSDFFETTRTESSNWKLSYGGGAGALIPISSGRTPILLNVGAQYFRSGRTTYLTRDDIHPDENTGRITITPRTTDVRYVTYRLGVTATF